MKAIIRYVLKLIIIYCFFSLLNNKEFSKNEEEKTPLTQNLNINNNQINDLQFNLTKLGESLDKENILQKYPRPQFVRDSYLNLRAENGNEMENGFIH